MLQIIKNNTVKKTGLPDSTLLGKSNGFVIQVYKNEYFNNNAEYWRLGELIGFRGVSTENLNLSFNTEWTDTGGAKLSKKVSGYVNGSLFKAIASQSDKGFQPMILTDEWTQQKMSGSSPIKVDLTFKLYNKETLAGSKYRDAILFLTHICAPPKKVQFGKDSVELVKRVGGGVYNLATDIKETVGATMNSELQSFASSVGVMVNAANDIYTKASSKAFKGINNGNFTVLFQFADKIFTHDSLMLDTSTNTTTSHIDWIVTNFSFTPSTQFEWDDEKKLPIPLWCDFKVSLETRLTLSNKYVYDLLHKDVINLKTEPL
jgi:hypothetical protein